MITGYYDDGLSGICMMKELSNLNTRPEILKAVKKDGLKLEYVSAAFQDDREIVMEAVRQNGLALAFASKRLKYDLEIIENLS